MKKRRKRWAAMLLAAVTSVMSAVPAGAAAPQVHVDETMYVNLDYYGQPTAVNVVKSCAPNGNRQYMDYGVYDRVVNMTDRSEPVVGDGTVTWELPEDGNRFYYQCTMPEGSVELPWHFDVSYRLNGVETDAAHLAGASGLVEIRVKAEPNEKARAYYKNNMILTVIVPVDMEKCYSVEAPGSQLQTVGSSTAALFMALPGEEGDYTVRIGTDDYESVGVLMMMVPGTAGAFDHIKDLKEAKDTWREDGDRMYESLHQLLGSLESMRSDVERVKGGLGSLDSARSQINDNRHQIESLSEAALSELRSVTDQMTVLIPYLQTARNAVTDINANANALYNTMEDMQDELDRLYDRLGSLRNTLSSASAQLESGITPEEQQALGQLIAQETEKAQEILDALGGLLGNGVSLADEAEEENEELEESLEKLDAARIHRGNDAADTTDEISADSPKKEVPASDGAADTAGGSGAGNAAGTSGAESAAGNAAGTGKVESGSENAAGTGGAEAGSGGETGGTKTDSDGRNGGTETVSEKAAGNTEAASGKDDPENTAGDRGKENTAGNDNASAAAADAGDAVVTAMGAMADPGLLMVSAVSELPSGEAGNTLTDRGPSGEPGSGGVNDAVFEEEMGEAADAVEERFQALSGTAYSSQVRALLGDSWEIFLDGQGIQQSAAALIGRINGACSQLGNVGDKTASTVSALRRSTDELINLLDDTRVMIDTMDSYVPSMLDALTDSEELMNRLTRALYATHDLLSLLNDTLTAAGDSLDAGTRESLQGLMGLLDTSLEMLDDVAAVREAGEGMKGTLDEQLDKFEDENKFLNLDPEAEKISFTSAKNPSPNSLQIILRTEEISDEDETTDISDLETEAGSSEGPLQRMWNVIVEIFRAILEIFRNR